MAETVYHPRYKRTPDHERYAGWEDFRANCHTVTIHPALAARWRYQHKYDDDVNEVRLLLIAAHLRLDRYEALAELPHRQAQRSAA